MSGLSVLLLASAVFGEVGLEIGPDSAAQWTRQPSWQGNPSAACSVTAADGALDFSVPEPNRGMKWSLRFAPVDTFVYRWLVVRYRMVGYAPGEIDYLVWCAADGDGLQLLPPNAPAWDEAPHVVAWDLQARKAGDALSTLAVQCRAGAAGDAHVIVESIALVDRPPADAEGDGVPVTEARTAEPDVLQPGAWTAQESWLGNPTDECAVAATETGLRFAVARAGQGMKWSAALPESIDDMLYLSVRYRAQNLDPQNWNYFLYLAAEGGGQSREEQYCVSLADVQADGDWHVATAPVAVRAIKALAVQVQAQGGPGYAEIDWLRFSNVKPEMSLADLLAYERADDLLERETGLAVQGPLAPAADTQAAVDVTTWFDAPVVSVRDVRFRLIDDGRQVAATSYQEPGEIRLGGAPGATEVYLLLGARFARSEEPSYGGGQLREVTYPHRFVAQVTYEDGMVDEFIPAVVPTSGTATRFAVKAGLDAYVIGPLAAKAIRGIVLRDGMRNGQFLLAGATANRGKARFLSDRPEARPLRVIDSVPPALVVSETEGLSAGNPLSTGPLFSVREDGEPIEPGRLDAKCDLARDAEGRQVGRLQLTNAADQPITIQPTFPDLALRPAPEWGDSWYFFPRRGCVINHVPIGLREAYSGAFPFQVESVFWPDAEMGLYVMTRDLDLTHRYWRLSKDDAGVRMSIEYPETTLRPGETWTSVETVLGVNQGDWHGAWDAYRDWLNTWYRPAAPRKDWFRRVFNFRQHFLHFELPTKSGLFDNGTKQFGMAPVIDRDIEAFGGVDYLHLFDWGWSEEFGRCGDYDHWEQLGGAENFAGAVAGVQQRDIPVGLYIEGYLVDPPSNYGKAHGEEYQLLDAEGKPYSYFAPSYNMCSAVTEWQDYLAGVYRRTRETTGAKGYYVDQMGFTDPGHVCYATNHGHPTPFPPAPGQRELMRKIREALGPDAALYTEESPPDVTSQLQDGSFTYNHASVSDTWSPTHLNLYRFTIPSFKTFEIIVCDKPLGSNVQAVKRVFFSGEGLWIEGIADEWFTPETRAAIAKTHAILRDYADAFTSERPTPLIPTRMGNVYANAFPADEGGLCVWTLYNANPRTVRGPVLRVPHKEGAQYLDAWNSRPAEVRIVGEDAEITLELGPKDVGCVVRTPVLGRP